jgi:hypothetical protein
LEAISKTGFWFKVSRQERGTEVQPAGILKYSEELKRGPNTEIGTKDIFEIASNSLWEHLPKGFFVLRRFRSIYGFVIKKYMEGGDKKEINTLRIVLLNSIFLPWG